MVEVFAWTKYEASHSILHYRSDTINMFIELEYSHWGCSSKTFWQSWCYFVHLCSIVLIVLRDIGFPSCLLFKYNAYIFMNFSQWRRVKITLSMFVVLSSSLGSKIIVPYLNFSSRYIFPLLLFLDFNHRVIK